MIVMYSAMTLSIEIYMSYTLLYTVRTPWTHLHRRRNFSLPTPSLLRTGRPSQHNGPLLRLKGTYLKGIYLLRAHYEI